MSFPTLTTFASFADFARANFFRRIPLRNAFALALLLVCAAALTGCTSLYTVTFNRGTYVTVKGKPRYNKANDTYILTDPATGREYLVPSISIREIAPASSGPKGFSTPPAR